MMRSSSRVLATRPQCPSKACDCEECAGTRSRIDEPVDLAVRVGLRRAVAGVRLWIGDSSRLAIAASPDLPMYRWGSPRHAERVGDVVRTLTRARCATKMRG